MIGLLTAFAILSVLTLAVLAPVFFEKPRSDEDEELATYFTQIDAIRSDTDIPEADAQRAIAALQRQILARQKDNEGEQKPSYWAGGLAMAGLIAVGGLVYLSQAQLNPSNNNETVGAPIPASAQMERNEQLMALVAQLEQRLLTDRADDPQGWRLYARSLITLGNYERAIEAYDRAVLLSEGDSEIVDERRRALEFIETRRNPVSGPTEQDIQDAQSLSPEDRQAMIVGMVDGLAARLEETPDDPDGWVRLLRARQVLGQSEQLQSDLEMLRDVYAEQPEILQQILETSGVETP